MKNIPISNRFPELDVALRAASEAGKTILDIYGGNYETSTKKDSSPITEADLKSNEIIKNILSETGHKILSEEDKDDQSVITSYSIHYTKLYDFLSSSLTRSFKSSFNLKWMT